MSKKYIILILIAILVITGFYWFFFIRERGPKVYTLDDFPDALKTMNEDILKITIDGLNKEYQKLGTEGNEDYWTWIEIGILKKRLLDYKGTKDAWEEAMVNNPEHALAVGNLADLYLYHLQDYEKAEEYYQKVLMMNPYHYDYYYGICSLYRYNLTDKMNLIEGLMLQGAEKNILEASTYYMYLANFFAKEGNNLEKAKEYTNIVLQISPNLKDQLPDL